MRQLLWDKGQHSDNQPCASWELTPGNGLRRLLCGVQLYWGWLQLFWGPCLAPSEGDVIVHEAPTCCEEAFFSLPAIKQRGTSPQGAAGR